MFVLSKRNIVIPGPRGVGPIRLTRDGIAEVPDWVVETDYFKALVAEGKIVPTTRKDRDQQAAAEKKTTVRRGGKTTKE